MIKALLLVLAMLQAPPAGLSIVVIEGEDAVNIIQQKTAVRPVVEVRDRNNLPVSGALVTFSIEGGKAASFGGASTLTVATNAAGQAAVTGLTPSAAGAFQIQVQAAFQGQVATATIAQTNVMTAAQAAAAAAGTSGTSGTAGTSSAAGASGGGGLSATTIGIVGGAVAGGALAATQLAKEDEPSGWKFSGPMTGQIVSTFVGGRGETCSITRNVSATMTLDLDTNTASAVSGRLEVTGTDSVVSQTCSGPAPTRQVMQRFSVSGTPAAFGFREAINETRPSDLDPTQTVQSTTSVLFEASLSGDTVTGTFKLEERSTVTGGAGGVVTESSNGTFPVTLRKSA